MKTELEEKVLSLIEKLYCCKYNHELKVELDDSHFTLRLYVHDNKWCPLTLSILCESEDEFLNFVEKELKSKNLIRSDYYKINLYGNY